MAGRQPFVNPGGLNLFPMFENAVVNRNSHQYLNQLRGLGMPQVQPNMNRDSYNQDYRGERMGFSDNYDDNYDKYYGREEMASNDRGAQRTLREPSDSRNLDGGDYPHQDRGRIRGLMDREIPLDCLFPEMESARRDERYGRDESERGSYRASKTNSQSGPFRSQSETRVDSSHDKSKDVKLSPNEIKYGKRGNTAIPWNAQLRPNCYLVPPLDDTHVQPLSERQPGCCTVFVGGLPGLADEFIIKEIFNVCGLVENITYKNVRKNTQVRYCQVRFYKQDSVEKAVKFNGHVLVIGDGSERKAKISRIRVNYDKVSNDNKVMKTNITVNRQKPVHKEAQTHSDLMYNRKKAFQILDLIRHDTSIVESLEMMAHWFEKGECNRTTVNVFHTMLSTTHSLVKRLISKRTEHEQRVQKQKMQAVERANEIKQQCEAVWKVFEAASKQKSWDNFTKGQRKTIAQWHAVIKNEIRSAREAEIQNREEVGMDLDDEVPSLGGLIEQPALQMAEGHQNEQEDESLSPSKAKKQRRDASESGADSTDALKLENAKLRTQVEGLKGIAEQNTNLLWSMQSYQYQADMTRQQYSDRLIEKDQEIIRLHKALQHIKQNIKDNPQTATSDQLADMQIVVELSKYHQTATTDEVAVRHEDSKEYDGEAMKEEMMGDDDGRKVEETTESHNKVDEKESDEQIRGNEEGNGVYSEREDLNNKEESSLPSPIAKGDSECEGVPIQKGNSEIELAEMSIEEGKEVGVLAEEEEKQAEEVEKTLEDDAKLAEEEEKPMEGVTPVETEKPIEGETSIQEEENPTEQVENEDDEDPGEGDKGEEGSGRFVQIDDEQFEVIDDMDEDSEDDYKEVAAHSALNENVEQMNEQLASDDAYKEVAACSPLNGNDEQVIEQLPSKDDYKDVAAHSSMNENVEQVNEQLPADLSDYQQDYSAQYQTWPLAGMASYGSIDYGPSLVRLSGEELVLVGIMCSYLHLCPSGATSGEIRDYLSRQFQERRKDVVEKLLFSLPVLFKAGESSGNTKWKFCGFEMAQSKSEN